MTDRELMQMALNALESSRVFVTSREKIKHPEGTEWYDERIEALRAALAQPEQEPVAWELNEVILNSIRDSSEIVASPQREWQGLTGEEVDQVMPYCHNEFDLSEFREFARAIEAKLKEKNT